MSASQQQCILVAVHPHASQSQEKCVFSRAIHPLCMGSRLGPGSKMGTGRCGDDDDNARRENASHKDKAREWGVSRPPVVSFPLHSTSPLLRLNREAAQVAKPTWLKLPVTCQRQSKIQTTDKKGKKLPPHLFTVHTAAGLVSCESTKETKGTGGHHLH